MRNDEELLVAAMLLAILNIMCFAFLSSIEGIKLESVWLHGNLGEVLGILTFQREFVLKRGYLKR